MFSKKVLSIDIGTFNTKLVVGKQLSKAILIEKAFVIPTPANSYQDGQLLNIQKLQDDIYDLLISEKIKIKKAICTTESSSIITRELVLPYAKPKELKNLVHFEIQQYLPIMMEEYLVEYKIIEEFMEEDNKKLKVQVAVLPKKIALDYLKLLEGLKLNPIALDIHNNAISKLFDFNITINDEIFSSEKTVAIIDLGHSHINISIIDNGSQKFSRIIPNGGKNIDVNIANSFNLSIAEAQEKKKGHTDLKNLSNNMASYDMINELIRSNVDIWIEDIQRIFKYYTSRNTENSIDDIYLYGGSSKIEGIDKYFNTSLNIPTYKINKIDRIKYGKELEMKDLDYFLNAIASIIRR